MMYWKLVEEAGHGGNSLVGTRKLAEMQEKKQQIDYEVAENNLVLEDRFLADDNEGDRLARGLVRQLF